MSLEYLSDIELYYLDVPDAESLSVVKISGDEFHHIVNVMKHRVGDTIKFTDGRGNLLSGTVAQVTKIDVTLQIAIELKRDPIFENITFCIPVLKNNDRMETAIEKAVELGFTKFIIFYAKRSMGRKVQLERFNKIAMSAMKQSLNLYKAQITLSDDIQKSLSGIEQDTLVFDVTGTVTLRDFVFNTDRNYALVFGPEGGLTEGEMKLFNNNTIINLINSRLRAESAIIYVASALRLLS